MASYRYLLLVACSHRKSSKPGLIPAIERYDGVNFRVICKAMREGYFHPEIHLLILSAKYGLLESDSLIENYDLKLNKNRARELKNTVSSELDELLISTNYEEIFINLSKTYLLALSGSVQLEKLAGKIRYASGGIGQKMAQMKTWLKSIPS